MKKDWEKEVHHLNETVDELEQANQKARELLHAHHKDGIKKMQEMDKDISRDFSNISSQYETLAQMEIRNREIDQMNFINDSLQLQLDQTSRLLEKPYFARIDVEFEDEDETTDLYLGVHAFVNDKQQYKVYDWRSPVAELYYNQELGKTSYEANGNEIPVDLKLRRQFQLKGRELLNFFDSSVAIQDELLLAALESNSSEYMQDITATIQKEQNEIIREMKAPVLLVNGIAGSGKTSAILQRIAYLLYQDRVNLKAEDVVLFSPNPIFMQYISQVLPNLGEKNPTNLTMYAFLYRQLNKRFELIGEEEAMETKMNGTHAEIEKKIESVEFLHFLINQSKEELSEKYFRDVLYRENSIISKEKMREWFLRTPKETPIRQRLQATALFAEKMLKNTLDEKAKTKEFQDKILMLTEEQQEHFFGSLIDDTSQKNVIKLGRIFLRKQYKKAFRRIKTFDWVDLKRLFEENVEGFSGEKYTLDSKNVTVSEAVGLVLLEHLYFISKENRQVKMLLVDEVQDYSLAQIYLIEMLFSRAKFTLLGDENQAIFDIHSSFEDIEKIFSENEKQVKRRNLLTSYRSSGAVTELFSRLVKDSEEIEIAAIQDKGEPVETLEYKDNRELLAFLEEKVKVMKENETYALLTKNVHEARELFQTFNRIEKKTLFHSKTAQLPKSGTLNVLPISLAKGLEFDHVWIFNANQKRFQTDRDRRLLYTMVSRAMKSVTLFVNGTLTGFLQKSE